MCCESTDTYSTAGLNDETVGVKLITDDKELMKAGVESSGIICYQVGNAIERFPASAFALAAHKCAGSAVYGYRHPTDPVHAEIRNLMINRHEGPLDDEQVKQCNAKAKNAENHDKIGRWFYKPMGTDTFWNIVEPLLLEYDHNSTRKESEHIADLLEHKLISMCGEGFAIHNHGGILEVANLQTHEGILEIANLQTISVTAYLNAVTLIKSNVQDSPSPYFDDIMVVNPDPLSIDYGKIVDWIKNN